MVDKLVAWSLLPWYYTRMEVYQDIIWESFKSYVGTLTSVIS